jgi:hypothetical protein
VSEWGKIEPEPPTISAGSWPGLKRVDDAPAQTTSVFGWLRQHRRFPPSILRVRAAGCAAVALTSVLPLRFECRRGCECECERERWTHHQHIISARTCPVPDDDGEPIHTLWVMDENRNQQYRSWERGEKPIAGFYYNEEREGEAVREPALLDAAVESCGDVANKCGGGVHSPYI